MVCIIFLLLMNVISAAAAAAAVAVAERANGEDEGIWDAAMGILWRHNIMQFNSIAR